MSDDVKPLTREKLEESVAAFEEMGYTVHVTGRFLREIVATAMAGLEATEYMDALDEMGVEAIYFRDGQELKPRSQSLRAALRNDGRISRRLRSGRASPTEEKA